MIENFEFYNPTRIIFGEGSIKDIANNIVQYSRTKMILVVISNSVKNSKTWTFIQKELIHQGIEYVILDGIHPNPSLDCVYRGKELIKNSNIDFILAVGGASVIDTAKVLSIAAANDDNIWDLVVNPEKIERSVPLGVVITLYGSGTEMTNGAVITNEEVPQKRGFDSPFMFPKFSIIDPETLETVNNRYLHIGMMDMFSHLLEVYFEVSNNRYLCDSFLESLARNMIGEFRKTKNDSQNNAEAMWMSTLVQNKTLNFGMEIGGEWCAHIISHEFCLRYDLPHGIAVSVLLISWLKFIKKDAEQRFINFGKEVFKMKAPTPGDVIKEIEGIYVKLGCPTDFDFLNLSMDEIVDIAEKSLKGKKVGKYKQIKLEDVLTIIGGTING